MSCARLHVGTLRMACWSVSMKKFVDDGQVSKWGIPDAFVMMEHIPKTSVTRIERKPIKRASESALIRSGKQGQKLPLLHNPCDLSAAPAYPFYSTHFSPFVCASQALISAL